MKFFVLINISYRKKRLAYNYQGNCANSGICLTSSEVQLLIPIYKLEVFRIKNFEYLNISQFTCLITLAVTRTRIPLIIIFTRTVSI